MFKACSPDSNVLNIRRKFWLYRDKAIHKLKFTNLMSEMQLNDTLFVDISNILNTTNVTRKYPEDIRIGTITTYVKPPRKND